MMDAKRFFDGPHSSCAVIGAQWGDEGKGKITDVLAEEADIVVRYQGGDNAGHTVVVDGEKTVLHVLPSGAIRGKTCVMGRGMVLNLASLLDDIQSVKGELGDILVDGTTPVITPFHIEKDCYQDEDMEIGTTSRGIGPTYSTFVERRGLRVMDFEQETVRERLEDLVPEEDVEAMAQKLQVLDHYLYHKPCVSDSEKKKLIREFF